MKAIDIFLRAIEEVKGMEKGVLISRTSSVKNSRFPAYTDMLLEIYALVNNNGNPIPCKICTISSSQNFSQVSFIEEAKQKAEDKMAQEAMVKLLNYYGI